MKRVLQVVGVAAIAGFVAAPALAFTELMPGKLFIAKPSGKLVKVLSKPTGPLFQLPAADPSAVTTTLQVFDSANVGGDDTYSLNVGAWKGLGTPPGAKGWKYKGAGTAADPCKVVIIKEKIVKAVCKDFASGGGGITLTPPFSGTAGAILSVDTDQYCAEWGGTEIKNDVKLIKRKDAPAPGSCPSVGPPPTATNTATPSPTATETPPAACPLAAGNYTLTQVSGGNLTVDGLPSFPFPAGGTIVQTVAAASAPACVHDTVVPFPGGFSAPVFCIPALGFTTSVVQTGCGIGLIDSNGGSDFTITEVGDTSSPVTCGLPEDGGCTAGGDSSVQVDVTVGNAAADVCGSGTANATVSVPVFTTTWLKIGQCPDLDGMLSGGDTLIVSFPQTLDFTTDSTSGDWADLDPDGCCIAGAGPGSNTNPCTPGGPGGLSATGTCVDLTGIDSAGVDTTTVAAGAIGSSGSPLYDLTFVTVLPNEMTTSGGPVATCGSPPLISYGGTVTRCIP